jgi:hypothetical protein
MGIPAVGTLYNPTQSNIPWSQPGGPGTKVFPQQQNGPWLNYPTPGQFFIEATGLFVAGCGHWQDAPRIFIIGGDNGTAVVCCAICTYVQYTMPAAQFYSTFQTPITLI